MPSNPKDFVSGLLFIGISGILAAGAYDLPVGTSWRMGPGYFPLALTAVLALLGLTLVVQGLRTVGEAPERVHWRALLLIIGSVVTFGLLVRPLGFLPAVGVTALLSTLASVRYRPATMAVVTAVLVVFCWIVFSVGLGLPWPLFGRWLS